MIRSLTSLALASAVCLGAACAPANAQPALPAPPAAAHDPNEIAVAVTNRSEPVLCAEKDNIQIDFTSPRVRSFRIQAAHPAYIGMIGVNRFAPDFTACDMSGDPVVASAVKAPVRRTIFETPDMQVVAWTYPTFWRAAKPIRVLGAGGEERTWPDVHMIQVFVSHRERSEEVLVLYPPDGYWRARPLPYADMRWTAYGSSFLIGPVEVKERPIVNFSAIAFDGPTKTFRLSFARGGAASLKMSAIDAEHMAIDVALDGATPADLPFASLRSMYITETNNDAARIAFKPKDGRRWGESNVMDFKGAEAAEVWVGRTAPSRHNTSAPDMIFSRFLPAK